MDDNRWINVRGEGLLMIWRHKLEWLVVARVHALIFFEVAGLIFGQVQYFTS